MPEFLKLKKSNCRNCYKCIRNCPVKSIRFSGNQAHIVSDECILCGQCFVVCPQNAKEIADDTEKAKVMIASEKKVIASIAPSFTANYNGIGIKSLEAALKKLGFFAAEETSDGAAMVKREYERIISEKQQDIIISSCCPSVNLLIQKHFPEALKYLARVITPMQAHCKDIKRRHPDAVTVFIGPCLSKKDEAERYPGYADCVLTFEDITKWMASAGVVPENIPDTEAGGRSRLFPTSGGIIKSMVTMSPDYSYISVDGPDNCISALQDIISGGLTGCFIEMSSCRGSCIGGPVMEKYHHSPIRGRKLVDMYAGSEDIPSSTPEETDLAKDHIYIGTHRQLPGNRDIEHILRQMGKTCPEDELNCGTCGYNTCREKAAAVYQGKADMTMCLPFLKDKAESFSDNIIKNTPNGIIVLNETLEVQQVNDAALKIMSIRSASDVLGEHVIRILEPELFSDVLENGRDTKERRVYLAEYKKYVDLTIVYDKNFHILICIMRDVTSEEAEREKKRRISRNTIETTDKVVEKQMRVVQEIAYLLGETAAETKIALSKLKESLEDE